MRIKNTRSCRWCGTKYLPKSSGDVYCGETCRQNAKSTYVKHKKKVKKESNEKKITDIAAAARDAGMSYGQYVAKMGL